MHVGTCIHTHIHSLAWPKHLFSVIGLVVGRSSLNSTTVLTWREATSEALIPCTQTLT